MSDKVQKIAILGGSFDPATNAHIELIRKLGRRFSRVIVLPCYISPFKHDGCAAEGEDRVKMLRGVTNDLENVKVTKWEIKREQVSYTVDAVKHYEEKYEGAQIWFVVGSDCLPQLGEWKDAEYLAEHVTFLAVRRPGFPISQNTLSLLREAGFTIKVSGYKLPDTSSTLVRAAVAFGKADTLVPESIASYIDKHELYRDYAAYTAAYEVFGLKRERIEHTYRAVKAGIWLAKLYGEDVNETVIALLLHDIGKHATPEVLQQNGIAVDNYAKWKATAPSVLHAFVSAAIARDYFGCNPRIVSAIEKHTTGAADMSVLDKIVYLADAVEEGREYEGAASLRRLAARDLDRAMLRSLRATVKNLQAEGKPVCELTTQAVKRFTEICAAQKAEKNAAPVFSELPEQTSERTAAAEHIAAKLSASDLADTKTLARCIADTLEDKKGKNIVVLDVAQKTVIADYFVIATANSTTQVRALADYVDDKLSHEYGIEPLHRDVSPKWYVLDYGGVIVHIQHREVREYYRLENLWS